MFKGWKSILREIEGPTKPKMEYNIHGHRNQMLLMKSTAAVKTSEGWYRVEWFPTWDWGKSSRCGRAGCKGDGKVCRKGIGMQGRFREIEV